MTNRIKSRELLNQDLPLDYRHVVFDLTDSTMNDMQNAMYSAQADDINIHGLVIQALEQTSARGGTDLKTGLVRQWKSNEENLMFSMAVDLKHLHHREVYLTGVLAAYKAINSLGFPKGDTRYKPPNDICIDGKKICGILTHADFCLDNWCNLGVGVNVGFAPNLDGVNYSAACLADFGWSEDKKPEEFLKIFLGTFQQEYKLQLADKLHVFKELGLVDDEGFCEAYDESCPDQIIRGRYQGIVAREDEHDYLLIEDDAGKVHELFFLRAQMQTPNQSKDIRGSYALKHTNEF